MSQLSLMDLPIFSITPLDQLLPRMKINPTICSHGDSFLVLKLTASLINPRQGSHLLHYIKSVLLAENKIWQCFERCLRRGSRRVSIPPGASPLESDLPQSIT